MALLTVTATNNHGQTTTAGVSVFVYIAPPDPPQPPPLPVINIYPLDVEGAEVSSGAPNIASFRVTHSFPATATVRFFFAMGGSAHEGTDYTLSSPGATITSGTIGRPFTFAPGTTEAIVAVNPIHDFLIENAETVTMSLYTPPFIGFNEGAVAPWEWQSEWGFYYGASPSASVNILDIDTGPPPFPLVTIAATDPVGTETTDGSDPAVFTVTRGTGPIGEALTVNYALTVPPKLTIYVTEVRPAMAANGADFPTLTGTVMQSLSVSYTVGGSATNGVDYVFLPGVITIPAGSAQATILVNPYTAYSFQPETVSISLNSRPTNVFPPAYAIISTATMPSVAAVYIVDSLSLSPKQRQLILRRRHLIIPTPPIPPPVAAPAPALTGGSERDLFPPNPHAMIFAVAYEHGAVLVHEDAVGAGELAI